jgi:hypothetical protein
MASTTSGKLTQCEVGAVSRVFRLQFQLMNLVGFWSEEIARPEIPNLVFIPIDALVWRFRLNHSVLHFGAGIEVITRLED